MAMIGPDMNMEGRPLFSTNFEIISVPKKSCHGSMELKINNELVEKELSCVSFFDISHLHVGRKFVSEKLSFKIFLVIWFQNFGNAKL